MHVDVWLTAAYGLPECQRLLHPAEQREKIQTAGQSVCVPGRDASNAGL